MTEEKKTMTAEAPEAGSGADIKEAPETQAPDAKEEKDTAGRLKTENKALKKEAEDYLRMFAAVFQ